MDMTGEYRIPAPRQRVWEALNDPEVLKAAIPGCDELVKKSDTELEARVTAKVGPVSAKFKGRMTLFDVQAPDAYTLQFEGQGGVAGFAKGEAQVGNGGLRGPGSGQAAGRRRRRCRRTGDTGRQLGRRHATRGDAQTIETIRSGERRDLDRNAGRAGRRVRARAGRRRDRGGDAGHAGLGVAATRGLGHPVAVPATVRPGRVGREKIVDEQEAQKSGRQWRGHLATHIRAPPALAGGNARRWHRGQDRTLRADHVLHRFSSLVLDEPPTERALPEPRPN